MSALLADAGVDAHHIDESFLWVEQRDDSICLSGGFKEKIETPFSRWTVGYLGDPTTILAHGCAFQAALGNRRNIYDFVYKVIMISLSSTSIY